MKKRIVAGMMLSLLLCACFVGYARETTSRASELINSCSCIMNMNGTTITASATINAKTLCDKIGFRSLVIQEYRDGKWVTVIGKYSRYKTNKASYAITLSYTGKSGAEYRAQCKAYVEDDTLSDTASQTTGSRILP